MKLTPCKPHHADAPRRQILQPNANIKRGANRCANLGGVLQPPDGHRRIVGHHNSNH